VRTILLTLSYDGTPFCGWQRQTGQPTVQAALEDALAALHRTPTPVQGAGRTDSGVHAAAQGATFRSPVPAIPVENYVAALNHRLPPAIRILAARDMPPSFSARFDARKRTYRYFIRPGLPPAPRDAPYVWHIHHYPSLVTLNRMAAVLTGELDCTTFSASGDQSPSKHRFIHHAAFFTDGASLVFEITANAFLWKMVRSLVGTLIDHDHAGRTAADFRRTLESRDRSRAGQTAPPQGLFLWHVEYGVAGSPWL
jgi:tRNA pseudouridine38-40 synthase